MLKSIFKFILIWLGLFIASIFLFAFVDPGSPAAIGVALFSFFGAPALAFYIARRNHRRRKGASKLEKENRAKRTFQERERLISEITKHRPALQRNLVRAVKKNDYDAVIQDNTFQVYEEFLCSIALDEEAISFQTAMSLIDERLSDHSEAEKSAAFDPELIPSDPFQFESWVALSLEKFGWKAETTQGGSDQGIDVIATRDSYKLALQCKLYSSAVGNSAVQEALAGSKYYGASHAAVLTNAGYTKSATELANSSGVLLLSQYDIPALQEKLDE